MLSFGRRAARRASAGHSPCDETESPLPDFLRLGPDVGQSGEEL